MILIKIKKKIRKLKIGIKKNLKIRLQFTTQKIIRTITLKRRFHYICINIWKIMRISFN